MGCAPSFEDIYESTKSNRGKGFKYHKTPIRRKSSLAAKKNKKKLRLLWLGSQDAGIK